MENAKPLKILGIDPGSVSAAYAMLAGGFCVVVDDVPVADKMVDAVHWARVVRDLAPDIAIIESVSAMPKQGSRSGFRFGMGVGLLRGVIAALHIPLVEVPASRWKPFYRLGSDGEKSRALAIRMFPEVTGLSRVKDHNRAEALLLAAFHRDAPV